MFLDVCVSNLKNPGCDCRFQFAALEFEGRGFSLGDLGYVPLLMALWYIETDSSLYPSLAITFILSDLLPGEMKNKHL